LSKIIAIGTAVPAFRHKQEDILQFMQLIYSFTEADKRRLRFLYHQSHIDTRYSVIPDYSRPCPEWKFYPHTENLEPFPSLELRMTWYHKYAPQLSVNAIRDCIDGKLSESEITHLITVSCTGLSAPGLDLQVMELLDLPRNTARSSINFMGCYAGIHALKTADAICQADKQAKVLIVCTELCTLHFQREPTMDNIASSLLFGDGSAAAVVTADEHPQKGLHLDGFYSEVIPKGKKDMAWEVSSTGFLMTLSNYIPDLLEEDFAQLTNRALAKKGLSQQDIAHWCIHPGGKKILETVHKTLSFQTNELQASYDVMRQYGNMSSSTIFFVLKKMAPAFLHNHNGKEHIFGAAFGPGLTMETFVASTNC
jgi:predicted naringenin-chalcone synthase